MMAQQTRYDRLAEKGSRKRSFWHAVAARVTGGLILKAGLAALGLAVGAGALSALFGGGSGVSAAPPVINTRVLLTKLVRIGEYSGAQAQYSFNVTCRVHSSFWFLTGETIKVVGKGSEDASINFAQLKVSQIIRSADTAVSIILPSPKLGPPAVNLKKASLSEKSGLFTHISHLFENDPNDARLALAQAQSQVATAAAHSKLIDQAKVSARTFLVKFLQKLGFKHVAVVFL